ncbi:uncharacterized protein LOC133203824 [Saccostrea echinata]|uniref:uncharacterized protein LOC133203824 n=1 Tax=Saccostrea echinata TaxID=191078 RepID=UPI002A8115BC|nr:uncharacterized protein LOC133203824 [Saccostrea echinata]
MDSGHAEGPSASKRRRAIDSSPLSSDHLSEFDSEDLLKACFKICETVDPHFTLSLYKLKACNAAISYRGVRFSEAFCDLESFDQSFLLGDIFRTGLDMGIDFLEGRIPEARHQKIILERLIKFLKEGEKVNMDFENENDATSMLANHLFAKLATCSDYTIDQHFKRGGNKCACGIENCVLTGDYGDTSIGNPHVWHGNVDIIIKSDIIIQNLEDKQDEMCKKSPAEVKSKNNPLSVNAKLVAETIVFSFLQKKRHPELSNFLIPCVGISDNAIILMFYDSEHDVLLESSPVPLYLESESRFSVEAVFIAWLAVNYRFLCTGLTEDMLQYKAGFFAQAETKINVYKNDLKMPIVGVTPSKERVQKQLSFSEYISIKQNKIIELRRKGLRPKEEN